MNQKAKRVLIVDDEKSLLHTFSNSLKAYSSDLEVLTAENGLQAVVILNGTPVDLVVTDLRMPEMDGFQLLIHMKRHFPGIPVIVMTAIGSPEVADRLKAMGGGPYLDKPINIKELALKIFQGIAAASQGRICAVTLAGFLQLIVMERKSCALKIRSGEKSGTLLIKDGELIDARTEDMSGEAAACDIVTWDDTEIKMGNYTGERRKNIDAGLSEILLDAFRMKAERERAARDRAERADPVVAVDCEPGVVTDDEARVAVDSEEHVAAGGEAHVAAGNKPHGKTPAADAEPGEAAQDAGADGNARAAADRSGDLRDLLSGLSKLQGVRAACLAGSDGFLIDSIFNAKMEPELAGAIASAGFGASESIGRELGRGALELTILEFERGAVVIAPVGKNFLLVILTDKDANLGMLRIKIRKLGREIEAAADAV